MFKCRIIGIHFDLSQHGSAADIDTTVQKLFAERVLKIVSDVALAHGHADRQRTRDVFSRIGAGQLSHGFLNHADLRSVSMRDDKIIALLNKIHNCRSGLLHRDHLLGKIISERISPECQHNSLTHNVLLLHMSFGSPRTEPGQCS